MSNEVKAVIQLRELTAGGRHVVSNETVLDWAVTNVLYLLDCCNGVFSIEVERDARMLFSRYDPVEMDARLGF